MWGKLKNIGAGFIIYALLVIMGILLWPYASTSKKNCLKGDKIILRLSILDPKKSF